MLRTAFACTILAGTACTAPQSDLNHGDSTENWPILWQQSGLRCDFARPARYLIREPQQLARFAVCDVPVDFRTQMVLIVFLGPTRSHDLTVRFERIEADRSALRPVIGQCRAPEPDTRRAPTTPYCVAVIPRDDRNVSGFRLPGSIE